jgi:hypothetical protein
MSLDEAAAVEAGGYSVSVIKKSCSPRALFVFPDTPEVRDLLERYARKEILLIPARTLLIVRADLYRRARAVRGGL